MTSPNAPIHATALIAEDEPLLAEGLRADLARLWPALQVVAVAANGQQAVDQALQKLPALCFLDIRMPGLSGLEAAQAITEDWPEHQPLPLLVFVTAYDQYALQAFETQAADYLLKPVDAVRLQACIERLQRRLAAQQPSVATATSPSPPGEPAGVERTLAQLRALLQAPSAPSVPRLEVIQASAGANVYLVPIDEVIYFEAADKYVRVITSAQEHLIRTSLRELLPQLDTGKFWQVHRSVVVRASSITMARREESGKVTLSLRGRDERLTASRLYAHLFKGM